MQHPTIACYGLDLLRCMHARHVPEVLLGPRDRKLTRYLLCKQGSMDNKTVLEKHSPHEVETILYLAHQLYLAG